jgi:hypothetical protein
MLEARSPNALKAVHAIGRNAGPGPFGDFGIAKDPVRKGWIRRSSRLPRRRPHRSGALPLTPQPRTALRGVRAAGVAGD